MTERIKTVTDHLLEAQAILDSREVADKQDLNRVSECIDRAFAAMNLLRCEAQTALDKL